MYASSPPPQVEWSLLLAACSGESAATNQTLFELLPAPIQWKLLLELAEKHGVLPLLTQGLCKVPERVPPEVLSTIRQSYQTNLHKALFLSRELIRVLDKLSAASVETMPYKGLVLAESLYGDIALRQSGDMDLLVRAADLKKIKEAVGELGFTSTASFTVAEEAAYLKSGYECSFDGKAGKNLLEVQWAIQPRFYAVDLDMEALFQRAVTVTIAGCAMKTPSPEDLFLILALHAAKHMWGRLIWICDLARLSQSAFLNWEWIGARAKELGISRILRVSLKLAEELFHSAVPSAANACLQRDAAATALAGDIGSFLAKDVAFNVESVAYFRWMVRLRERRRDQLRFITRLTLTPGPGEWSAVRLPGPLFPLYRLVRIWRLAVRVVQNRV